MKLQLKLKETFESENALKELAETDIQVLRKLEEVFLNEDPLTIQRIALRAKIQKEGKPK